MSYINVLFDLKIFFISKMVEKYLSIKFLYLRNRSKTSLMSVWFLYAFSLPNSSPWLSSRVALHIIILIPTEARHKNYKKYEKICRKKRNYPTRFLVAIFI